MRSTRLAYQSSRVSAIQDVFDDREDCKQIALYVQHAVDERFAESNFVRVGKQRLHHARFSQNHRAVWHCILRRPPLPTVPDTHREGRPIVPVKQCGQTVGPSLR